MNNFMRTCVLVGLLLGISGCSDAPQQDATLSHSSAEWKIAATQLLPQASSEMRQRYLMLMVTFCDKAVTNGIAVQVIRAASQIRDGQALMRRCRYAWTVLALVG